MEPSSAAQPRRRLRFWAFGLGGVLLIICFSGCDSVSFYRQAIAGECQILTHQQPIPQLVDNTNTPPALRKKFVDVLEIRAFAESQLKLPVDGSYIKYVDLHRDYVVWNVTMAPALSLQPKTWWFPVVGRAGYRGYFSEKAAKHYARKWKKKGWDVYVAGVQVYSTLGWFRDPLLSTFVNEPEGDLAEIIFHELGHQRLFVAGDTEFNEAFATTVAMEGIRRWFAQAHQPQEYERYHLEAEREAQFIKLVLSIRPKLQAVYGNPALTDAQKLEDKKDVIEELRREYATMRDRQWGGDHAYDGWFKAPINNAKLNTIAEYYDFAPAFESLLRQNGGDMERFYQAVTALARMPIEQRHEALHKLMPPSAS